MKRSLRTAWTCSDYVHHQHRWRWTAWLCGRWQCIASYWPPGPFEILAIGLGLNNKADLDVELDNITANIDESMKNISSLQRGKENDDGIHNVRNA